jgi:hypothetical protein
MTRPLLPALGLCVLALVESWQIDAVRASTGKAALALVTQKTSRLDGLSLREVKRLYLGEHVDAPDGKKLVPINQAPRSPERGEFERLVLSMSPDEVGRFWIDRKIRGQPGPPRAVSSLDLLRRAASSVPGTVAYLKTSEVGPELKVLRIEGKRPGEPGYPLEY